MDHNHIDNFSTVESDNKGKQELKPFFSIGVTTYNRPELLKQTLASITKQTFSDFEVIVGNDYTQETLSAELLGIQDPRIRFVNHPQNLGELGNMNALLGMSRGKYFTWQFDDDLYAANFLQAVHSALVKFDFPSATFTSYEFIYGTSFPDVTKNFSGQEQLFSGRQFLRMYLSDQLKVIGCTGVYDIEYIRQIGGVERLTDSPFALYSEYLLLVRSGLLKKVAYIDAPLVLYRSHEGSWGCTTNEVNLFKQASENLVRESVKVFSRPELRDDFRQNIGSILKFSVNDFVRRLPAQDTHEGVSYLFSMKKQFNFLKGSALYWIALSSLGWIGMSLVCWPATKLKFKSAKLKFKSATQSGVVKLAHTLRSFFFAT